jgi:hypothetical protein
MQKTMFMFCIFLLTSAGCVEKQEGKGNGSIINIVEVPIINLDNLEILTDPSKDYPFPGNDCVNCSWYFCPPMTSVWQKEICIDYCLDPPAVVYEGECSEYLQCDPTQYLMEEIECITEEGFPGIQDKVCNKGLIQYTDCVTTCQEENCNYEDDDCDGLIDEGQINECGTCGLVPAEECNGLDDDCDDVIDENLINPCANACGSGYEVCQNGNWVSCTAPSEKEEICDGLDNDCDGKIDEGLECMCTLQDVGVLFPCQEDPLICGQGFKTCQCADPDCTTFSMTDCFALCYWVPINDPSECDPLIGIELEQEKCNNFDDNCNQKIDEDLYTACYTGPEGTLMVGICEPGTMTCEAGTWGSYDQDEQFKPYFCKDEVVPQEEICNGIDDDCDGITDWGEEMSPTDVLFIVDWSGSMSDEMGAVMISLNQFAQTFSDEEVIKWSFMRGPVAHGDDDERLELVQDLTGFSDFLSAVANMDGNITSSGNTTAFEMLLDAIYLSVHNITTTLTKAITDLTWAGLIPGMGPSVVESSPPLQNFNISWRPGADRIIIVFSDEGPQSYLFPNITKADLISAILGVNQLKLYTFSKWSGLTDWEEIANMGNGEWYELTSNPTQMYSNLMEILDNICQGGTND